MKNVTIKSFARELVVLMPALMRGILKTQSDAIARGEITMPQYLILDLLETHGGLIMTELAHSLNVSLPAASGMVDRLHALSQIRRCRDPKDRRIIKILLTPKGHRVVRKVRSQRIKAIEKTFGRLTEEERQSYLKIIKKVYHVLDKKS
ncbi:MAG: MarR family transcriptional regulator [Candidatus Omnitrophota bacterium]